MIFLRVFITHLLIYTLVINTSVFAVDSLELQASEILTRIEKEKENVPIQNIQNFVRLTDKEKAILKRVGLTDQEIEDIASGKDGSIDKVRPKVNSFLEQEKKNALDSLKKEVIPGFASSVISMAFASFLGITLITKCRTMPSALVFSGASAFWVASELANWNGYKIKVENIDTFGTPNAQHAKEIEKLMLKIKSITENANNLANDINGSLDILRDVKSIDDFDKLEGNNEAEKMKALALEVFSLQENIKILKTTFGVYFDEQYLNYKQVYDSVNQVKETTDKKAKNTKIAATGFALASALAFAEHFDLIKANGACFAHNDHQFLDLFISKVYAADQSANIVSKKVNKYVENNLYDGKTAQTDSLVGNLDKIGILAGAGLGAAYVGFKMKFLNKILASGMSRGIVFGILAGIAYFSAVKLKEFSDYLKEKLSFVEELRAAISERLHLADKAADDVVSIFSYVKLTVIPFIEDHFQKMKINIEEAMDDLPQEMIEDAKDDLKDDIKNKVEEEMSDPSNQELLEGVKEDLESKIEETIPKATLIYRFRNKIETYSNLDFIMKSLTSSLIPNLSAARLPNRGKTSCFVFMGNFVKEDKFCKCRKNNSCLTYNLPQIYKTDSKVSSFLSNSTKQYMSNINGYLNGYGDIAGDKLTGLTKENGHYQNVSDQIIEISGQDKAKINSMIKNQVSELIGSIPKNSLKKDNLTIDMNRLKSPKNYKRQRAIKKLKRLINFKEKTTIKSKTTSKSTSNDDDDYAGYDYSQYKPNDIHKKEDLNLFDIISNRYERHFEVK